MTLSDMITYLIILCEAGVVFRIILLFLSLTTSDEDEVKSIKKRIRNLLIFGVLAACILPLRIMIMNYFK